MKTITVRELIEELTKLPKDLPVQADGCDCIGPAMGAKLSEACTKLGWESKAFVLIKRVPAREAENI